MWSTKQYIQLLLTQCGISEGCPIEERALQTQAIADLNSENERQQQSQPITFP